MENREVTAMEGQEYVDSREAQLRERATLIGKVEAQGERVGPPENVAAYYRQVDGVRAREARARRELRDLQAADGEGWFDEFHNLAGAGMFGWIPKWLPAEARDRKWEIADQMVRLWMVGLRQA